MRATAAIIAGVVAAVLVAVGGSAAYATVVQERDAKRCTTDRAAFRALELKVRQRVLQGYSPTSPTMRPYEEKVRATICPVS